MHIEQPKRHLLQYVLVLSLFHFGFVLSMVKKIRVLEAKCVLLQDGYVCFLSQAVTAVTLGLKIHICLRYTFMLFL